MTFGSAGQRVFQAIPAKTAPAIMPIVKKGKPHSRPRWLILSRSLSDGKSRLIFPGFLRFSKLFWMKYMAPAHDASTKRASPIMAKTRCNVVSQLRKFSGSKDFPDSSPAAAIIKSKMNGEIKDPSNLVFVLNWNPRYSPATAQAQNKKKAREPRFRGPAEFTKAVSKLTVSKKKATIKTQVETLASITLLINRDSK